MSQERIEWTGVAILLLFWIAYHIWLIGKKLEGWDDETVEVVEVDKVIKVLKERERFEKL